LRALQDLLADTTAGDPISGLKWTHRSLRKLSKALRRKGWKLTPPTIARLLRQLRFSLRTCRKQRACARTGERDRQFRYLIRLRKCYLARGFPVISVDTKKKEWIGDFKNPGRAWRLAVRLVLDHDWPRFRSASTISAITMAMS
jgi:hypothetical protein